MTEFVLGQHTAYPSEYDPTLLFPIQRSENRASLGLNHLQTPPFFGVDIWNAYELSWLNPKGKPQIALAEFVIPADSPNMVESKSWIERIKMAFASSIGYMLGAIIVYLYSI